MRFMHRGVYKGPRDAWRCVQRCMEVCREEHGGVHGGMFSGVKPIFAVYFRGLYRLERPSSCYAWMSDNM